MLKRNILEEAIINSAFGMDKHGRIIIEDNELLSKVGGASIFDADSHGDMDHGCGHDWHCGNVPCSDVSCGSQQKNK